MSVKKSNSARGSKQTTALKGATQKPKVRAKASKPQAKKQTRTKSAAQVEVQAPRKATSKPVKKAAGKVSKAAPALAKAVKTAKTSTVAKRVKGSTSAAAAKSAAAPKVAAPKIAEPPKQVKASKAVSQKPKAAAAGKASPSGVKVPAAAKRVKSPADHGATPDVAGKHLAPVAGSAPAQLSLEGVLPPVPPGSAVDVGDHLPEFVLVDQNGVRVTSDSLLGAPVVLYFYPKDDTPGCTAQACGFRDEVEAFSGASVRVVGVSPDKPASHGKFAQKYELNFTLLADVDRLLCVAFGVWKLKKNYGREYLGVERSTFLLDAGGRIARVWRGVRVAGHVAEVLEAAKQLSRNSKQG